MKNSAAASAGEQLQVARPETVRGANELLPTITCYKAVEEVNMYAGEQR
jgi:hypothetical protein